MKMSDIEQLAAQIVWNENDIEHFGIKRKSGRYPWGSGKRPYQSGGGVAPRNETPEQREERKQKALKTATSATEIKEFANELTNQELEQALKRIELNSKLNNYAKAEREAGMRKIDEAMKKVGQINNWGNAAVQSLNNINAVVDLWMSFQTAKKGEYKKYKEYVQQQNKEKQQKKK